MTPAHVRRAVDIYLKHAWPPEGEARPRITSEQLEGADTMEECLDRLERGAGSDELAMQRYTLRLGNARYPFMKFVVQEYLVGEEFFFSVDTHDNLDIRPGTPDYDAWEELKVFNRDLRARIEREWDEAGLPTNNDLRALVEQLAKVERGGEAQRARLLLVDDERNVCLGLAALLKARGYEVELAHDGQEALDRLAREPLPDLVLLDYEMPALDGEEVLRRLRSEKRTARLPVLMATASSIDLERVQAVSGLLRKPYPRHVLFEMIARILKDRQDTRS